MTFPTGPWKTSPARAQLISLYREADELAASGSCVCHEDNGALVRTDVACCHFAVTGREPYPTAVEIIEVLEAVAALGIRAILKGTNDRGRRSLPTSADQRRCPLLDDRGRCRIYQSRPLGCRTFFCTSAGVRLPRKEIQHVSNAIADLSARTFPRDPGPRPFLRALASATATRPPRP